MATLGVYGMVSYSVRQRTVEIGTRMALGAVSRDVLTLIVGGGLKTAAYGMAIGGVAVAAARLAAGAGVRRRRRGMAALRIFHGRRCSRRGGGVVVPRLAGGAAVADGRDPR